MAKRVAVISDVHANWHALDAVLQEIEREEPDELWCLGDLVDYGPRPNPCCAAVERRATICLSGNHDLGVLGEIGLEEFAGDAVAAARWTRGVLAEGSRTFLRVAAATGRARRRRAVPREPARPRLGVRALGGGRTGGVRADPGAAPARRPQPRAARDHARGRRPGRRSRPGGHGDAARARPRLLNPGSVGQPRDGDPRAAWLLLDREAGTASFRRVEYDVARTQEEIRERGLPDGLADRLALGL